MRATRPIALPSDCSAATNDDFTVTKTIDTITLQGDRAAVTVTDRTAINAKRKTSGKTIVIENVVVTKEDWERDAEGQWSRTHIAMQSFHRFEDGKLVEGASGPAAGPRAIMHGDLVDGGQARVVIQTSRKIRPTDAADWKTARLPETATSTPT